MIIQYVCAVVSEVPFIVSTVMATEGEFTTLQTNTCSASAIETLEKGMKYV